MNQHTRQRQRKKPCILTRQLLVPVVVLKYWIIVVEKLHVTTKDGQGPRWP
jgi:hypothetical protein